MELISQLENILRPEYIQRLETAGDAVKLEERQKGRTVMTVQVSGVSAPFTAVRMSKRSHPAALKDGTWKKICDYLLIGQSNGKACVIFVELKKRLREEDEPKEQLWRSLPILRYLLSVCEVERGSSTEKSNLTLRYVIIAEELDERIAKQGVRFGVGEKLRQELYKSIHVATFVGTTFDFDCLASD